MPARFSLRAQQVIQYSREEALRLGHDFIGTEHLLLGIIRLGDGLAVQILHNLGCDLKEIRESVEEMVEPSKGTIKIGNIPFTKRAEQMLKFSYIESKSYSSELIGTEFLLLAMLKVEDSMAAQVLNAFHVTYDTVKSELDNLLRVTSLSDTVLTKLATPDSYAELQPPTPAVETPVRVTVALPPQAVEIKTSDEPEVFLSGDLWAQIVDALNTVQTEAERDAVRAGSWTTIRFARIPLAVFFCIIIASIFAYSSLYFGLVFSDHALTRQEVINTFIALSSDGSQFELGPNFWVMHTTFLPMLGFMLLVIICWIGKAMLVPVEWYFNRAKTNPNPLVLTASLFGLMAAIFLALSFCASTAKERAEQIERQTQKEAGSPAAHCQFTSPSAATFASAHPTTIIATIQREMISTYGPLRK